LTIGDFNATVPFPSKLTVLTAYESYDLLLVNEVKATLAATKKKNNDTNNINEDLALWKTSLNDRSIKLTDKQMPNVDGSYDMAWQQKGSGRRQTL
jgi:hypothetical protein